jgi:hypothetical protein
VWFLLESAGVAEATAPGLRRQRSGCKAAEDAARTAGA